MIFEWGRRRVQQQLMHLATVIAQSWEVTVSLLLVMKQNALGVLCILAVAYNQ